DSGYVGNESMQVGGRGLGKFDRVSVAGTAPAGANKFRASVWMTGSVDADSILYMEALTAEFGATSGAYFDGDTAPSGNLSYRWAPDGTSLEIETIQPPEGRTTVWDGEPYKSTSTLWVGPASGVTGVMDVGISTDARLGIV